MSPQVDIGDLKSQKLKKLYNNLFDKSNSKLWKYFVTVLIKHSLQVSTSEEKVRFSQLLYIEQSTIKIEQFILDKLPKTIEPIKKEMSLLRNKLTDTI